ncbi:hypothetical protein [Roseovarius mucosus]|uniref:hypothetical protein n=1 Tax=Roseovarius mucosus TaxID=215743 RepID=UPI003F6FF6F7
MDLHVQRWGHGYAVFDGKARVSGAFSNRDIALRAQDRMQDEALKAKHARNRPCLTCGTEFWSMGPGHRMCGNCRTNCAGLDAQMVG